MSDVAVGLANIIGTLPKWTPNTNLFVGNEKDGAESVSIKVYQGTIGAYHGPGHHGRIRAQVLVRGPPGGATTAFSDANAIFSLLRDCAFNPAVIKPIEILHIYPRHPEPIQLQDGANNCPRFAFDVEVLVFEGA